MVINLTTRSTERKYKSHFFPLVRIVKISIVQFTETRTKPQAKASILCINWKHFKYSLTMPATGIFGVVMRCFIYSIKDCDNSQFVQFSRYTIYVGNSHYASSSLDSQAFF